MKRGDLGKAARHVAEREKIVDNATALHVETTTRYAKLCASGLKGEIVELAWWDAVYAFEGMLDALRTHRDALIILDGVRNRGSGRNKPLDPV